MASECTQEDMVIMVGDALAPGVAKPNGEMLFFSLRGFQHKKNGSGNDMLPDGTKP